MKILVLDNYDSFTYNLVEYIRCSIDAKIDVFRNDEIAIKGIDIYQKIVLSPGPGIPDEAGILKDLIKTFGNQKSILGICLGHQAIAEVYGGTIKNLSEVYHGVSTKIINEQNNKSLLGTLPRKFEAGRYHSWIVEEETLPDCFEITCKDKNGMIMGIIHKKHRVEGVQFHPESILTPLGMKMIENWLKT